MDRVRLGRALGYGTRHAAKTVAAVVEAATATPSEPARRPEPGRPSAPASAQSRPMVRREAAVSRPPGQVRKHARAIWQPLAVFSGALLLRVTGVFFALIAATLGAGAWRLHTGVPGIAATGHRFWLLVGLAAVFAYFAGSSFVRARVRERRA